jgi:hypothetical protein
MDHIRVSASPFLIESEVGRSHYTHLFACIREEDGNGGFILQVRLSHNVKLENAAWGEELTDCFETASMLVSALAAEFSIAPEHIEMEIRMQNLSAGTRH